MLADSVGALVTIHSPYIQPVLDENSIFVAPGSAVSVSLHVVCHHVQKSWNYSGAQAAGRQAVPHTYKTRAFMGAYVRTTTKSYNMAPAPKGLI